MKKECQKWRCTANQCATQADLFCVYVTHWSHIANSLHFHVQKMETQSYCCYICKLILHLFSTFPTDSTKYDMETKQKKIIYWQLKVLRQKTTIWLFLTLLFFFSILLQLFEIISRIFGVLTFIRCLQHLTSSV